MEFDFDENFEEEFDKLTKQLNEDIITLPENGIYKIILKKDASFSEKREIKIVFDYLVKTFGRSDITVMILNEGDIN